VGVVAVPCAQACTWPLWSPRGATRSSAPSVRVCVRPVSRRRSLLSRASTNCCCCVRAPSAQPRHGGPSPLDNPDSCFPRRPPA
jgi:hypothetical protein